MCATLQFDIHLEIFFVIRLWIECPNHLLPPTVSLQDLEKNAQPIYNY